MKTSDSGMGLIEVMASMAILAVVVIGLAFWTTSMRQSASNLASTEACYERARSIATNIKSFDNDITIRNWIPDQTHGDSPTSHDRDPLCSDSRLKKVCDDVSMWNETVGGVRSFFNFLNRRNAATWAYTVYSKSKKGMSGFESVAHPSRSGSCYVYLVDFDPLYLPTPVRREAIFGDGPGRVNLVIEQKSQASGFALDCNSPQVEPLNPVYFDVTVELNYRFPTDEDSKGLQRTCAAQTNIGYVPDNTKAGLRIEFRNRQNVLIPQIVGSSNPATAWNLCLDPATSNPYTREQVEAGDPFGFKIFLAASEPGVYMRCSASVVSRTDPKLLACTKARIEFAAGSGIYDGDFDWLNSSEPFNTRPQARLQYGNASPIPYASDSPQTYAFAFDVTDVGRNQNRYPADLNSFFHLTMKPACPGSDSYCPSPYPPPNDGCGGDCPEGTRRGEKCPDPRLYCGHHKPCDDCEKSDGCPTGSRGSPGNLRVGPKNPANFSGTEVRGDDYDCPAPDTYYPCEKRFTWCGAACPVGTKPVPAPNPNDYCQTTNLYDLCGEFVGTGVQASPSPACGGAQPSHCPPTNTYCPSTTDIGGVPGTDLRDFDNTSCGSGSVAAGYSTGGETIGCPSQDEYCQGTGQFVYDSCGRACPSGLPKPEMNWCCMGCSSLADPPSFKKATSCQEFRDLKGSGSCFFDTATNCNQYQP